MISTGVAVVQEHPPERLRDIARLCETLGYTTLWVANEKFYRNHWIALAIAGAASSKLKVGTYVADPYSEHPALIAAAIASLDELTAGRALLLLGAGGTGLHRMGIPRDRPAVALREAVAIVRGLLAGETVDFEGRLFRVNGLKLSFPARTGIPILIASRGDHVLTAAGECADGAMVATYATPAGLAHALGKIAAGRTRSGRAAEPFTVISRVDGWIDRDGDRARNSLRSMVARLLTASYPDRSFARAAGVEIPAALEEVCARRNREEAAAAAGLVTDELLDAFTWAGTAEQVAEKVAAVIAAGAQAVTFMPHPPPGERVETGIRAFAEEVVPRVRSYLSARGLSIDA